MELIKWNLTLLMREQQERYIGPPTHCPPLSHALGGRKGQCYMLLKAWEVWHRECSAPTLAFQVTKHLDRNLIELRSHSLKLNVYTCLISCRISWGSGSQTSPNTCSRLQNSVAAHHQNDIVIYCTMMFPWTRDCIDISGSLRLYCLVPP